jgi:hypothetical protein
VTSEIGERPTVVPQPFAGEAKSETNGTAGGKVEWAVWWPATRKASSAPTATPCRPPRAARTNRASAAPWCAA